MAIATTAYTVEHALHQTAHVETVSGALGPTLAILGCTITSSVTLLAPRVVVAAHHPALPALVMLSQRATTKVR